MLRRLVMGCALLALTGCALPSLPKLPALPKLPSLPRLPALPKLPAPPPLKSVLPVVSSGESLKDAYALALPVATAWEADAVPVKAIGHAIDPGGRDGGYPGGYWLFDFASTSVQGSWLAVTVKGGVATKLLGRSLDTTAIAMPASLDGIVDSPDAVGSSSVKGELAMILAVDAQGPAYTILQEGATGRAVLDATTGKARSGS